LILFVTSLVFAQKGTKEPDIVYTKLGKIEGTIVTQIDGRYVEIRLLGDNSLLKIDTESILSIYHGKMIDRTRDVIFTSNDGVFEGKILEHFESNYIILKSNNNQIDTLDLTRINLTKIISYDYYNKVIRDAKYNKSYSSRKDIKKNEHTIKKKDIIITWRPTFYKGKILEHKEDESIVIETFRKIDTLDLSKIDLRRVISYTKDYKKNIKYKKPYLFNENEIYASIGHLTLYQDSKTSSGIGTYFVAGYQFSKIIGLGIGVERASYTSNEDTDVRSFFLETRGFLLSKNLSPYYSLRVGSGSPILASTSLFSNGKGGIMIQPTIGCRVSFLRLLSLTVGVGYKFQKISYQIDYGSYYNIERGWYRRFCIDIGFAIDLNTLFSD